MEIKTSKSGYASADEVEAAFYDAFGRCDLEAMQTLWADRDAVCVHPGAEPVVGHEAVVRSWGMIFKGAESPEVRINVMRRIGCEDMAVHILEEHIRSPGAAGQEAVVFVTNVYRRDDRGWLMVEHHASLIPLRRERGRTLQ